MVFLWFSYGFPMVFLWFFGHIRKVEASSPPVHGPFRSRQEEGAAMMAKVLSKGPSEWA